MTGRKRKQKPRAPVFAPLERLEIGQPFNPYKLFVYGPVLRAVLAFSALNDGPKNLWILLADQCIRYGYDTHSQTELAGMLGWKLRKLRRHIRVLKKHKLVHVEWNLGEPARTWLLYHPLFASCSPLGTVKNDLTLGQKWPKGTVKNDPIMDLPYGDLHGSNHEDVNVGTSNSAPVDARGEDPANKNGRRKPWPAVPITNSLETPQVLPEFRSFWFSLPAPEQQNRMEEVYRTAKQVTFYRQYIHEKDRTTAGEARRQVEQYTNTLRGLGFYIPGKDPKGKP